MRNSSPSTSTSSKLPSLATIRCTSCAFLAIRTTSLPISTCEKTHNGTILSLGIQLPAHVINVQLVLPGLKTIGAIRVGLYGPPADFEEGRYTLLKLKFASKYVSPSLDQVLAPSLSFPIELTSVVNQTAPLSNNGLPKFSGIWSSSFSVNSDELFSNETRYSFFYRTQTNISVSISQSIFYVSNLQEPIARQTEVIFRSLLFTIVVLEVFGLLFLVVKLLLGPLFRVIVACFHKFRAQRTQVKPVEDPTSVTVQTGKPLVIDRQAWNN